MYKPFQLEHSKFWIINRTEFCECSFSVGLYTAVQNKLSCQSNTAARDGMFNTCYVFKKIHFGYLRAYHEITPKPALEQAPMLLISDVPPTIWLTMSKYQTRKPAGLWHIWKHGIHTDVSDGKLLITTIAINMPKNL